MFRRLFVIAVVLGIMSVPSTALAQDNSIPCLHTGIGPIDELLRRFQDCQ